MAIDSFWPYLDPAICSMQRSDKASSHILIMSVRVRACRPVKHISSPVVVVIAHDGIAGYQLHTSGFSALRCHEQHPLCAPADVWMVMIRAEINRSWITWNPFPVQPNELNFSSAVLASAQFAFLLSSSQILIMSIPCSRRSASRSVSDT